MALEPTGSTGPAVPPRAPGGFTLRPVPVPLRARCCTRNPGSWVRGYPGCPASAVWRICHVEIASAYRKQRTSAPPSPRNSGHGIRSGRLTVRIPGVYSGRSDANSYFDTERPTPRVFLRNELPHCTPALCLETAKTPLFLFHSTSVSAHLIFSRNFTGFCSRPRGEFACVSLRPG